MLWWVLDKWEIIADGRYHILLEDMKEVAADYNIKKYSIKMEYPKGKDMINH